MVEGLIYAAVVAAQWLCFFNALGLHIFAWATKHMESFTPMARLALNLAMSAISCLFFIAWALLLRLTTS